MAVHQKAREIAPFVVYEVASLFESIKRLERENPQDGFDKNQRIECALVHARVVKEFLTKEPTAHDVSARDFFDDASQWIDVANSLCPYLKQHHVRLNRSVPHLSYDRLAHRAAEDWNFHAIATEMKSAWETFLNAIPEDRRRWFESPQARQCWAYQPAPGFCARTDSSITSTVGTSL